MKTFNSANAASDEKPYWDSALYSEIESTVMANVPTFPDVTYNITDEKYASLIRDTEEEYFVADAVRMTQIVKDYTKVFEAAIAEANQNGGGIVLVPGRTDPYYSGAIHLKSNVNLHIEEGATIKFVRNKSNEFYPIVLTRFEGVELMNFSPFIYAYGVENIGITGKGVLDGQVDDYNWMPWKHPQPGFPQTQDEMRNLLFYTWSEPGPGFKEVEDRIMDDTMSTLRPCFIEPYNSKNILISDITVNNSPMWEIHPTLCENVLVKNVLVDTHYGNNDGCDPESCKYVIIEDSTFDTGDDCIAIKSGRNHDGRRVGVPSEKMIIRNNYFKDGHGGITMGSEISGDVRDILTENNQFNSPNLEYPIRFKTNSVRGGVIERIYFRNSEVMKAEKAVVHGTMDYEEGDVGDFTPIVRDVALFNIVTAPDENEQYNIEAETGFYLKGYDRTPFTNFYFKDCDFMGVNSPVYLVNALTEFDNVLVNGNPINLEPVAIKNVEIDGIPLDTSASLTYIPSTERIVMFTGEVETSIANFAESGSVHVSFDRDANRTDATLTYDNGRIYFSAAVGIPDGIRHMAIVARQEFNQDIIEFMADKEVTDITGDAQIRLRNDHPHVFTLDEGNNIIYIFREVTVAALLTNIESYAGSQQTYQFYRPCDDQQCPLGDGDVLQDNDYLEVTSQNGENTLIYNFRVETNSRYRFENMTPTIRNSLGRTPNLQMGSMESTASNGNYVNTVAASLDTILNDYLAYKVFIPEDGYYNFNMFIRRRNNNAIIKITLVDDINQEIIPLGQLDGYNSSATDTQPPRPDEWDRIYLSAGVKELQIEIVGQNPAITGNVRIGLYFAEFITMLVTTVTITVAANEGGSVSGGGTHNIGDSVTVRATPDDGYSFDAWYENGVKIDGIGEEYTFTANRDRTLVAAFSRKQVIISMGTKSIGGGSGTTGGAGGIHNYGDILTIIAVPHSGSNFDGWYEDYDGNVKISDAEQYTFTATIDRRFVAFFSLQ